MSKTPILLIAALMLLIPTTLVLAQDDFLPNRFVVPDDNLTIYYPHGWNVQYDPEQGAVLILNPRGWTVESDPEQGAVLIVLHAATGIIANWVHAEDLPAVGLTPGDAVAALEYFFAPLDETVSFDPSRVTQQVVDGRTVYLYEYVDIDTFDGVPYDGVLAVTEASDGSFFAGDIFGLETGSVDANDAQEALRIVAGVQFPETGRRKPR